jgi:arylsulfatase A-like enzyme
MSREMKMSSSISRRSFLSAACAGAAGVWVGGKAQAAQPAERPNIVFFLIDDQRNDTLGCAGHPILKTPQVDLLAAEGVRFRNTFVTTSICAASRASIFTGLHERTHGYTFGKPPIPADYTGTSYPALLRQAGYRTGFIGKFGVGVTDGAKDEMFDAFTPLNRNPYFHKQPDGSLRHETEVAGDHAIDFIGDNPADQPFCLSISFNAVHAEDSDKEDHYPWPKAVDGMYDDQDMPLPRLNAPAIFEAHPQFLKDSMNRERYFWRWDTPEKYQKNMRAYFRMISGVDRVVGRVRDALKARGLDKNTIVIYTGDNGYYMGNRGFAGKWTHYEESLRVPLIIYDPRLGESLRGQTRDQVALNIDLPATMLAYGGVESPNHYQGRSLTPLMRETSVDGWRTEFFCEHLMEHKAIPKWEGIRGERYVYARYLEQEPVYEFLHDLQTDPEQLTNFAADPAYTETLARMRARCDEMRDACVPARSG